MLVVQADIMTNAPVGQLFMYELKREVYQNEFEPFLKHYGTLCCNTELKLLNNYSAMQVSQCSMEVETLIKPRVFPHLYFIFAS